MRIQSLCILGGSGFVGRHIANRLANRPIRLRVPTKRRENSRHLLPIPNLKLVECDIHDPAALTQALQGMDAVINLVGVLNEGRGRRSFQAAHAELPARVAAACREAGVHRLLHMSALGAAPDAPSRYLQTKAEGERAVMAAHGEELAVTVFRPSVIFGPEDSFLNRFATMLKLAPVLPLPTPDARFKPVYVGDVADAFIHSLGEHDTFGETYELCGPEVYSLRELVEYCARLLNVRRRIIGLPDSLSRLQARVLQHAPGQPYTMENYLSSQVDNVCSDDGLQRLGLPATGLDTIAPGYLGGRRERARYDQFRRMARR